ncbi:hypothetical protein GCM10027578_21300 [Spirosoma luteolum]
MKKQPQKPLSHAFDLLADRATNSIAFHRAVLDSSALVRVRYVLTTTPALTVSRIAFGFEPVDLAADQDPADPNVFRTGKRKFDEVLCIDNKLMVEVEADGADGNGWSLAVFVNNKPLPANPIELTVNDNGNANHADLHQLA